MSKMQDETYGAMAEAARSAATTWADISRTMSRDLTITHIELSYWIDTDDDDFPPLPRITVMPRGGKARAVRAAIVSQLAPSANILWGESPGKAGDIITYFTVHDRTMFEVIDTGVEQ